MRTCENGRAALDRRGFLKGIASAAATAGVMAAPAGVLIAPATAYAGSHLPKQLRPPPNVKGTGERFWKHVRNAFALPGNYIHMNTGTTGSQPEFSLNNLAVYNRYKSEDPRDWQTNLNADFPDLFPFQSNSATAARQQWVAGAYGANQDEILLSYDTSDACNLIFGGTPWKAGDRIITTSFEHAALAGPIAWARDYHGVEVVVVDMPSIIGSDLTTQDVCNWFEQHLAEGLGTDNKQYLAFSEIFYKNGFRMPVPELCALGREYGAYSIVDSAHGWGMLPIDCHAYGADFIAGAGHKWLCGGPGTGICYVRTSDRDAHPLPPLALGNYARYGNLFTEPSANYNSRAWSPASFMQSRGENNTPALFAMTDSLLFFTQVGIQNIYDRGVALGTYLKQLIVGRWGGEALWVNPGVSAFATALTSFNPFQGKDDPGKYAALKAAMDQILANLAADDPQIYIRYVTWRSSSAASADDRIGFRVSTHAMYTDYDDIDLVFDRLVDYVDASGLPQLGG
jgi:isopenicillin-N epimerase